ncbi:DUF805 domain-containing protein [uncultured Secundilactobacillus sp.]|uniref:DUF805 domain-containing protein n=1 Tax=uncultured Secundilactobacillus sp. TaxID=2813935 RepID=UPI00258A062E|nr:DUF805 domain-containing protein [uncultured Secundilactobacillus sp.]
MANSYKNYWANFTNFSGTANRPEFWWPALVNYILGVIVIMIVQAITGHPISDIYNWTDLSISLVKYIVGILVFIANWSVTVRRLHDTDRSGWWILIQIIPIIGSIWLFVLLLLPGKKSRWS